MDESVNHTINELGDRMRIKDWAGIENGADSSVNMKQITRRGQALPVDVTQMWIAGLLDLTIKDGEVLVSMTAPQAELWRRDGAPDGAADDSSQPHGVNPL